MRCANPFVALADSVEDEPTPTRPLPSWLSPRREPVNASGPLRPAREPGSSTKILRATPRPHSGSEAPDAPDPRDAHLTAGSSIPALHHAHLPTQVAPLVIERLPDGALSADEAAALRAELEVARATIAENAIAMASLRREILEASEADLVQLATAIAERIVRREVRVDPELVAKWAQEGLGALGEHDELTVVISSDVAKALPEARFRQLLGDGVALRVDAELPAGSCEVRGRHGRYDASVDSRMAAILDALSAGGE
jgi:flagellar assembly protein FliH